MGAVRSFVRTERISTLFLTPSATLHPQRRRAQMVVRSLGRTARAEEGISPSSSPQASFQTSSRGLGVSASDSALSASSARSAVASCRHHCETGQPSHLRVGVGHPLSPRKHCTTGVPAALANNRNLSYGNALPSPKVPACSTGLTTSAFISCPCRLHIGCSICEVSTRMPATFLRGRRTFTPLRTMRYAECVMRPEHRVRSSPGSRVPLNP
jgi:hypothetical protein